MAESTFPFEILTPEHSFFSGEIEALTFTADDGEWTILKDHAPMLVVLRPGTLKIKQDGRWREAVNSEGYMEVAPHGTVLFAQTCEWPEDVDRMRAERAGCRRRRRCARATARRSSGPTRSCWPGHGPPAQQPESDEPGLRPRPAALQGPGLAACRAHPAARGRPWAQPSPCGGRGDARLPLQSRALRASPKKPPALFEIPGPCRCGGRVFLRPGLDKWKDSCIIVLCN